MPTASPISRDPALEAHLFWHNFKKPITAALLIVIVALIGFAGYRFYSDRRDSAASALLASAKNGSDYEQVIARYASTPAGAAAYLLLAETQRNERKFRESNETLQAFLDKNPKHELVGSARLAIAANLESMGKMDEALSTYQQIAASYPTSFSAPLALISQVHLLKAKNQTDAARRVCETILTQYRESFWAAAAMRELNMLKPGERPQSGARSTTMPPGAPGVPPLLARPPTAPAPSAAPMANPPKPR
jgi:predicted negative regulator of RcsB-dependent stress response